jgi:hypothetical protein
MSYLEHEPKKLGDCGCPSCDLYNAYLKDYAKYKTRNPYFSFDITDGIDFNLTDIMNAQCKAGYELAYVIPGHLSQHRIVVMRSVPPPTPNASDIIQELKRRDKDAESAVKNIDDFGPTIGEA